jgi:anti-sigma-K factor RskA
MIDERLEEQASLHVLGGLTAEETRAFEAELRQSAELRQMVAELSAVTEAVAGTVELVAPPPGLRETILAQIDQRQKIVQLPVAEEEEEEDEPERSIIWLPWALAACLTIICGLLVGRENSMRTRIQDLSQVAQSLQAATNDLQNALAEVRQNNNLANVHVTVLGALLPEEAKAVAVSLWDEKNQTGEFVAQSLTPLDKDKDYQLWVIDPQYATPVDAGVFQVDDQGKVRVQFKAKQPIKTAAKFAVTREAKGGSPTPKGTMVLLGG